MTAIVVIAVLALLASFACSLFEATLYAITPSEVELLRTKRVVGAARIAKLRAKIEEPIAAILTINTVANTLGSALCGALVADYYGTYYAELYGEEFRDVYAESAVGVFAGLFTLSVLIFSEIIPKTLGVRYATPIAPLIAWPLQAMIWVSWPVARGARALMHLLTGGDPESGPSVDEIRMLTRLARQGGQLRPQELRWVENALQLDNVTAADLMTPRTVVDSLPAEQRLDDLPCEGRQWIHTRLPLFANGNPDEVVGIVHGKDLLLALLNDRVEGCLQDLAQPIDFVPETMRGHALLDKFIQEKKHIVAVVDEHGGFEGIVSLEDVMECLLGSEIVDEHDRHADMQQVARRKAKQKVEGLDRVD